MGCGCRGFGDDTTTSASATVDPRPAFLAATHVDSSGVRWWNLDAAAAIRAQMEGIACNVYSRGQDASASTYTSGAYTFDRSMPPGSTSDFCARTVAEDEANGLVAMADIEALTPTLDKFIVATMLPSSMVPYAEPSLAAYLPPAPATGGGAQPGVAKVVPVWKQALMLGGLGVGLVGIIWFATRKRR